jgi:hypothetical protein
MIDIKNTLHKAGYHIYKADSKRWKDKYYDLAQKYNDLLDNLKAYSDDRKNIIRQCKEKGFKVVYT